MVSNGQATVLGTSSEVTLAELAIEALCPAGEETAEQLDTHCPARSEPLK